jgi:hypothetical protein
VVSDDVMVLRMVWHPFHFQDGELIPTAFDGNDLLALPDKDGEAKYMSMDDWENISRASVDWRIEWQQRDGRAERHGRIDAKFVQFVARRLRECVCEEGRQVHDVTREPTVQGENGPGSPENPAHCGVRTLEHERYRDLTKARRAAVLGHMRTQLMKAIIEIHPYTDIFPDTGQ